MRQGEGQDDCLLVIREGVGVLCVRASHQQVERTSEGPGQLPPTPDCWSPPDAVSLPTERHHWWHRFTR